MLIGKSPFRSTSLTAAALLDAATVPESFSPVFDRAVYLNRAMWCDA
jgi:hypothetical protein